ncbi:acyl-CoA thioesterase domain-containing protein [Nocardia camponoti]|uniref:Thioesterase n=1 Tax=Nocardia camponoti TaxID=1616106 RepID=A0A917V5F9_9NOCA|nr:acyl-CoA thioesterase domain-containing protein [Nocardia camponoti]GGK39339.1 thioesterase [Nocardia camponoti]
MEFFTTEGGRFLPSALSISRWSDNQLNGVAVCGLLAMEAEKHCPAQGFVPARFTVDLFRPVINAPISVHSGVIRAGNRIKVADSWLVQEGEMRARATVTFLATTEDAPGEVWRPAEELPIPAPRPEFADAVAAPPLLKCGDGEWLSDYATARNAERKVSWHHLPPLVAGLPFTPFQRAAATGDITNLVTNWGSAGVGYINADMTLTLARLPIGPELGLMALDQVSAEGVAVSTATLFDRAGRLGTCVISSVANARRQVHVGRLSQSLATEA